VLEASFDGADLAAAVGFLVGFGVAGWVRFGVVDALLGLWLARATGLAGAWDFSGR